MTRSTNYIHKAIIRRTNSVTCECFPKGNRYYDLLISLEVIQCIWLGWFCLNTLDLVGYLSEANESMNANLSTKSGEDQAFVAPCMNGSINFFDLINNKLPIIVETQ